MARTTRIKRGLYCVLGPGFDDPAYDARRSFAMAATPDLPSRVKTGEVCSSIAVDPAPFDAAVTERIQKTLPYKAWPVLGEALSAAFRAAYGDKGAIVPVPDLVNCQVRYLAEANSRIYPWLAQQPEDSVETRMKYRGLIQQTVWLPAGKLVA